ncbi:type IV pilus biogenesis/stability protein PilW [Pseudomonas stutzeri]|jgi:type IV pilus assembly protein PilF|uniref:type IV pilus biogenesis/stability protein PilW n=1 Tax=Pseudomonas TaxID=286 RepID=UPI00051CF112|nr:MULTISPECIES: type IV pilus biogenesis/stability protein PilW [Pseudomonas]KGK84699.1 pilus assembly protein PilW [Stutzerimonas degradans]MDT3709308.1 type IV pilus biogenesis/stability protein PilW [Pseudomonadaceae bacterium]MCQ4232895.1 type IV pilus biogenesis/stability protein PilW [Stutzerimonas degradans]OOE09033.1 type IV pilus biogenesis/stability protein PilW [Stutzerimonas degradans]QCT95961.1 type IV pilus biogenesis/stability protein PilW [Stutzerimonas degradans]
MTLRVALLLLLAGLTGCVSTGTVDPLKTEEGRQQARDAYIQLGIGYVQQGTASRAKTPLRKALELDPRSADAHAALALVFQTEMENELADKHYREALANRRDARILNNYGSFLFEQKRYPEALERFTQASEDNLYPERARVFQNMGMTALKLNQPEQAEKYFTRALRLDSRQPGALLELALMAYDAKQYVPAKAYYDSYSQLAEQNARSLLLGIHLADIHGDRDRAASLALQLKRLYPGTAEYQQYLSEQR